MNGTVDLTVEQRRLDLLDEQPFAPDLAQRPVDDAIARRTNRHQFRGQTGNRLLQPAFDPAGLRDGKRASSRTDTQVDLHEPSRPSRSNNRRMAST